MVLKRSGRKRQTYANKKNSRRTRKTTKNVFGTRRLRGGAKIFGFDGRKIRPIRTDSYGRIKAVVRGRSFHQQTFLNIKTNDKWMALPEQDTSRLITYSYAVVNKGDYPARVQVQLSPNSKDFATDDYEQSVAAHSTLVIVPKRFLRFTRLIFASLDFGKPTQLDIYFQAQSH